MIISPWNLLNFATGDSLSLRIEDVTVRKVVTINPNSTVKEASRLMDKMSTSCLVVVSKNKIDGIMTTKDVIGRVVARGINPSDAFVRDIMSSPVVKLRPNDSLDEAVNEMLKRNIKKLVLVNINSKHEKPVGILSLTDVVELFPKIFNAIRNFVNSVENQRYHDFYVA
jgi:signal-transduction protein with cAMP-binding, CBS, and nucleotidyltransferase domain